VSNKAINWAYGVQTIKGGPKFTLVTLADMADQEHSCYPGQEMLAELTGFSVSAIYGHLLKLHELGLITTERRHKKNGARNSDRYYLAVDGLFETVEDQAPEAGDRPENVPADSEATSVDLPADSGNLPADSEGDLPPDSEGAYKEEPKVLNPQREPTDLSLIADDEVERPELVTIDDLFDEFWKAYPRRVERKAAARAFEKAVVSIAKRRAWTPVRAADYLTAAIRAWSIQWVQREQRTPDKIPHAASWLNGERWTDELPAVAAPHAAAGAPPGRHPAVAANLSLVERIAAQQEAQRGSSADRPALDRRLDDRPHHQD
jgi:hypothetical protein